MQDINAYLKIVVASVFIDNRCHNGKCVAVFGASHPSWSFLEVRRYVARCPLQINDTTLYNQEAAIPKRGFPEELRLSEQQNLVNDDILKKAPHCTV